MLMNEDDFEIDAGSQNGLQGIKQEDPGLKVEWKLVAWERPGTPEEEHVHGRSCHELTFVTTMKEAAIFDCGPVVIDSANETSYP